MIRNVTIFGAGYVGLPTAAHLANVHAVTVYDPFKEKIQTIKDALQDKAKLYVHEKDLLETLKRNEERITLTSDINVALASPDIIFLAVGTPPNKDGRANLTYICKAAEDVAKNIKNDCILLTKSTVPPGTAFLVESIIKEQSSYNITVGSCPEFLAEGTAMEDLRSPSRIVVGINNEKAKEELISFFTVLHARDKILTMDTSSAECAKYFANAMLATRISFMNNAAAFADGVGANIHAIRKALSTDPRIGSKFLYAGFGYGGSCFPKDTMAVAEYAKLIGQQLPIIDATVSINTSILKTFYQKIKDHYGTLEGRTFAIWGIGFKADTNDVRESQSVKLCEWLMKEGANLRIFDVVEGARSNFKEDHPDGNYTLHNHQYDCITEGVDGIIIGNEEEQFRLPDLSRMSSMRNKAIFDGKNVVRNTSELQANGFIYRGVGIDKENVKEKLVTFLREKYMA